MKHYSNQIFYIYGIFFGTASMASGMVWGFGLKHVLLGVVLTLGYMGLVLWNSN